MHIEALKMIEALFNIAPMIILQLNSASQPNIQWKIINWKTVSRKAEIQKNSPAFYIQHDKATEAFHSDEFGTNRTFTYRSQQIKSLVGKRTILIKINL